MSRRSVVWWPGAVLMATSGQAQAQLTARQPTRQPASPPTATATASAAAPAAMAGGKGRKIDKALGKLTLHHGPIKRLDMAGMALVLRGVDPKQRDGLKPGDKLRFSADRIQGAIAITAITAIERVPLK